MPKKQSAVAIVTAARNLIMERERWTKGADARGPGFMTNANDPRANCYCAHGAIVKVCGGYTDDRYEIIRAFEEANDIDSITVFNDAKGRRHKQVIAAFDRTIDWLRKRAA